MHTRSIIWWDPVGLSKCAPHKILIKENKARYIYFIGYICTNVDTAIRNFTRQPKLKTVSLQADNCFVKIPNADRTKLTSLTMNSKISRKYESKSSVSFVTAILRADLRCSALNWDLWGALLVFNKLKVCSHTHIFRAKQHQYPLWHLLDIWKFGCT